MSVPVQDLKSKARKQVEARWPALIASLATGVLFYAMPETLTIGPDWLLFVVVAALMIPTSLAHKTGRVGLNTIFGYSVLAVITLAVLSSLILLVVGLPAHKVMPIERDKQGVHTDGAFLFPQMTMAPERRREMGEDTWSPGFIDYLFLAFNTS